jgi:hypothetical protein
VVCSDGSILLCVWGCEQPMWDDVIGLVGGCHLVLARLFASCEDPISACKFAAKKSLSESMVWNGFSCYTMRGEV